MSLLFRSSEHELETLRSAVRSLRETSVAGLAAALSWRTRKVEKLLVEELTRPGTAMAYDPARRVVRWAPPVSVVWSPPATAAPPPPPPPAPKVDLGPTLAAPSAVLHRRGLRSQCPTCHVPLVASASASLNVCPQCGRLFSSLTAGASAAPEPVSAPPPETVRTVVEAPPASATRPAPSLSDRRSQELLAAYVTAKPIPCPRCRTPLRHRGVSVYGCPTCGETVRFSANGSSRAGPTGTAKAPSPPQAAP